MVARGALIALLVLAAASGAQERSESHRLDEIAVVALAPVDQRAVLRLPGGRLRVVEPGDRLPGTRPGAEATLLEVRAGKLVLEETVSEGAGRFRRRVWLHRVKSQEQRSRLEVLDPRPPPAPAWREPQELRSISERVENKSDGDTP